MTVKLYVVPGSHPSMTGRLMLEHKGIAYRRVDLIPALHKPILRALGFPSNTVPAVVIDGKLADCCAGRGPEEASLRAAGLGRPLP